MERVWTTFPKANAQSPSRPRHMSIERLRAWEQSLGNGYLSLLPP